MSRWIGLEFDAQLLRVAIGKSRRDGVSIDRLLVVDGAAVGDDPQSWGAALASRLAESGGARADCSVVVTRNDVELRRMSLPPVPDDELPEMVRMQAFSEFSAINEQWLLDYIPFPRQGEDAQRVVLAAGLRPGARERWQQMETATGLKPQRMTFGPAAVGRWVYGLQASGTTAQRQLILQPHRDAWSLIVADAGLPVLVRWVRLSEHQAAGDLLSGEIRRTQGAAYSQLDGFEFEEVVLLGDRSSESLVTAIQLEEPLKLRRVDPLQGLGTPTVDANVQVGEFASLLATLREVGHGELKQGAQAGNGPALDFLNPHRRPEVPDRRRMYSLLAVTAMTLALAGVAAIWYQLGQLDEQIATAKAQERAAERKLAEVKGGQKQLDEWKNWEAERVQWLGEIARLSAALPSADVVKLKSVVGNVSAAGGGRLAVEGLAAQPNAIAGLDTALSDALHRVEAKAAQKNDSGDKYPWKFEQAVDVLPVDASGKPLAAATDRTAAGGAGGAGPARATRAAGAAGEARPAARRGAAADMKDDDF